MRAVDGAGGREARVAEMCLVFRSCSRFLVGLLVLGGTGCSVLPPPPPLVPEAPGRTQFSVSVGRVAMPMRAEVTSPRSGPVTLRQTWDGEAAPGVPAIVDPRFALARGLSEHFTLAAHLSWLTMGSEARYSPNGLSDPRPNRLPPGGAERRPAADLLLDPPRFRLGGADRSWRPAPPGFAPATAPGDRDQLRPAPPGGACPRRIHRHERGG